MPLYEIRVTQGHSVTYRVEAQDASEAENKALDLWPSTGCDEAVGHDPLHTSVGRARVLEDGPDRSS
jgi:hypothetical protein